MNISESCPAVRKIHPLGQGVPPTLAAAVDPPDRALPLNRGLEEQ